MYHDAHPIDPLVDRLEGEGCEQAPTHGTRHRNPRPKLTGAVACLHQFVIRHVEQITQLRLLQLLHKPAVEFLINVADTGLPPDLPSTR